MKLNPATRAALRSMGFTAAQWARLWGYTGEWGGDQCGCFDDRCALGFHHSGIDDCSCFPTMLDDAIAWRQASAGVNEVRLGTAPYGLFRYVTVSTAGVLATVSASAGGFPAGKPPESVVRLEVREGWTAEAGTDEHGRMVIRILKADQAAADLAESGYDRDDDEDDDEVSPEDAALLDAVAGALGYQAVTLDDAVGTWTGHGPGCGCPDCEGMRSDAGGAR